METIAGIATPHGLKRCAIYTRKSVQPPIPQQLTSLESQRAICSSYITSQEHKDWVETDKRYDDEGRSGSTLDRPALQELLTDIELGLVEVVLVYKMDRITRTLLDFVRLLDFFEKYGVVFVAITQNFDTGDSMGRLVRNILLTFAQFEREISIDRMRDKMRVMKQHGMWTGGEAPLGYDLRRGKLIINADEEKAVRCIFETYVVEKRIGAVERKLVEEGFRRKIWRAKNGKRRGGTPIDRGSVHHALRNPIYIGEVSHLGKRYPGIHQPIIDRALWDQVQGIMDVRRVHRPQASNLLSGLLVDGYGRRMYAREGTNRFGDYRYYSSRREAWARRQKVKLVRANADTIEQLVCEAIKLLLVDRPQLRVVLMKAGVFGVELDRLAEAGPESAVRMGRLADRPLSCLLRALVERVELHTEFTKVILRLAALPIFLRWDGVGIFALSELDLVRAKQLYVLDINVSVARECKKHTLPISHRSPGPPPKTDRALVSLLYDARLAQRLIFDNRDKPIAELARSFGRRALSFSRLVRLNYLAPDIVAAILDGEQPAGMSRKRLMQMDLPIDWALQRRILGFASRPLSELPALASGA